MTRRLVLALAVLLAALMAGAPTAVAASADANGLQVLTVLRQPDGATSVVAEVQPTPSAKLPADATQVTIAGTTVPATTTPLLESAAPTALVLDASADGSGALPQALSGSAGWLLGLDPNTPVTVIVDGAPPKSLTPSPARPVDVINLIAGLRPGGARSTSAAIDLALAGLRRPAGGGRSLVLLQTTGPAPQDQAEAARLSERLRSANAVLAVVTTSALAPGWNAVAEPSGGFAVPAAPDIPAAFDNVKRMLSACSVVTFTPPAGATSASLRLRQGAAVLPAEVTLPSASAAPSPAASPGQSPGTQPAPASGEPSGFANAAGVVVAGLVLLALVAAIVFLLWRQQVARTETTQDDQPRAADDEAKVEADAAPSGLRAEADAHDEPPAVAVEGKRALPLAGWPVPDLAEGASVGSDGEVPSGVRLFDVSDPAGPVEIDRAEREAGEAEAPEAEPAQAQAEPAQAPEVVPAQVEAAESVPAQVEAAEPEPAESEPVQAEPVQAEPVQAEPVQAEAVPAEAVPAEAVPVRVEAAESEPVQAEPVQAEAVPVRVGAAESEPVQAEPVQAEPVQAEGVPAEAVPARAEPVQAEAPEAEPAQVEAAESVPAQVEAEPAEAPGAEPRQAEAAESEPAEPEAADAVFAPPAYPVREPGPSEYVGRHRQGRHRPHPRPEPGESGESERQPRESDRRDRSA